MPSMSVSFKCNESCYWELSIVNFLWRGWGISPSLSASCEDQRMWLLYHLCDCRLCPGSLKKCWNLWWPTVVIFPRWVNENNIHLFPKWPEIWNWTFSRQKAFSWSPRPYLDHNTQCAKFNPSTVRIILWDSKEKWPSSKERWIEPVKIETLWCLWEIGWSGWGKRLLF